MSEEALGEAAALVAASRWAALGTLDADGRPLGAMTAFAVDAAAGAFVLHLSRLAAHTRNLLERPSASLVLTEPDGGERPDPQTLARLSIQGEAEALERGSAAYGAARACYVARLPEALPRFEFADFELFALAPTRGTWVGGFARARSLSRERLGEVVARAGAITTPARAGRG